MPAMHGESGSEALWAIENGFRVPTAGADIDYLHIEAREALAIAKRVSPDDVKNKSWLARVPRIAVWPPSQVHE